MNMPEGYKLVTSGVTQGGDKYWDDRMNCWLPITVNHNVDVARFPAVIRLNKNA